MTPSPSPAVDAVTGTVSAAPWWGVPVIAGAFLILGAVLGYVFNQINERRKEAREDSIKWHDELRSEAARLLSLAHQLVLESPDIEEARANIEAKDDTETQEALDALNEYLKISEKVVPMMTEIYLISSTIKLIAPPAVSKASTALSDAIGAAMSATSTISSETVDLKTDEFLQQVRYALGIDPEPMNKAKSAERVRQFARTAP